jgi:RHS repeat-associated protein
MLGMNVLTMTYTADGEKLTKSSSLGVKNYVSGIEYKGAALEAIYTSEGRCVPTTTNGSAFFYEYTIKDHLGNARVSFRANGAAVAVIQENHYYAFGMEMEGTWAATTGVKNNYEYNGKELNEDFGLNLSDYGARWYDAAVGRWWSVDPLAEKFGSKTSYNYGLNNPVRMIDPNGMQSEAMQGGYTPNESERANNAGDYLRSVKKAATAFINKSDTEITKDEDGTHVRTGESAFEEKDGTLRQAGSIAEVTISAKPMTPLERSLTRSIRSFHDEGLFAGNIASEHHLDPGAASDIMEFVFNVMQLPLMLEGGGAKLMSRRVATRAFWSGKGTEAKALEMGFETLGKTRAGKNLSVLTDGMPYYPANGAEPASQAYLWWARLSTQYAKGASGEVHVFQNALEPGFNMTSIWRLYEYQALMENPNVTKVIFHY